MTPSSRVRTILAALLGLPMIFLYYVILSWLNSHQVFSNATLVERIMLYTQAVRVGAVLAVGRLRKSSPALLIDLISLEMFAFAVIIGLYAFYGARWLLPLDLSIAAAWPSVLLCVAPAYWIFKLVSLVRGDGPLTSVVPWSVGLFAVLAFVVGATAHASWTGGFAQFTSLLLNSILQTRSIVLTPAVEVSGIPIYIALVVYAATKDAGSTYADLNPALLLVVVGTGISIFVGFYAVFTGLDSLLLFSLPSSIILTAVWWVTRAR